MNSVFIILIFLAISQLFIFYLIHYNRRQAIDYFTECLTRLSLLENRFDSREIKKNFEEFKRINSKKEKQ